MDNKHISDPITFVKDFLELVAMDVETPFRMTDYITPDTPRYHLFVLASLGMGRMIYGCSAYSDHIYYAIDPNFKVVGFVDKDNNICLMDSYFPGAEYLSEEDMESINSDDVPSCYLFESKYNQFYKNHFKDLMKPFYNSVEAKEHISDEEMMDCKREVRKAVVLKDYTSKFATDLHFAKPSQETVIAFLCGEAVPYWNFVKKSEEKAIDKVKRHKACVNYADALTIEDVGLEGWNVVLAECLWKLKNAALVSVTFRKNGLEVVTSMCANTLLERMANNCTFEYGDITPCRTRNETWPLLENMYGSTCPHPSYKDIVRVACKKKVIFERSFD